MGSYLFLFVLAAFMPQPSNNISQAYNPEINPAIPMFSNCNFSATLNIFTTIVPHSIKAINKRTSVFGKIEIEQKGAKMWAPQMAQKMSHCPPNHSYSLFDNSLLKMSKEARYNNYRILEIAIALRSVIIYDRFAIWPHNQPQTGAEQPEFPLFKSRKNKAVCSKNNHK